MFLLNNLISLTRLDQVLDCAIAVLKELDANEFKDASRCYLEPYFDVEAKGSPQFFDLPVVLVPPEAIDIENMGSGSEAGASPAKNEEWPEYRISLFDDDVRSML